MTSAGQGPLKQRHRRWSVTEERESICGFDAGQFSLRSTAYSNRRGIVDLLSHLSCVVYDEAGKGKLCVNMGCIMHIEY